MTTTNGYQDVSFTTDENSDFQSNKTQLTRGVNTGTIAYLQEAVENIEIANNSTFVICDYGAANTSGSFEAFTTIIEQIKKKYGSQQQVMIVYEDLICNDFNALFRVYNERRECSGTNGLFDNVFAVATANSFYNQCMPDLSVHLGFSALSMHWLPKNPCQMAGFPNNWEMSTDEERDIWVKQAAVDLENNLYLRAKELVKGGQMVLQMAGVNDKGESGGHTHFIKTRFYTTLNCIFRDMCGEGLITEDEFFNTRKNFYSRRRVDMEQPFKDRTSRIYKLGLRLKSIQFELHRCVFNKQWTENGSMSEEKKISSVKEYIESVRIWNECNWSAGLSLDRSATERSKLVDELYRRYENMVLEDPTKHGYDVISGILCIYKE